MPHTISLQIIQHKRPRVTSPDVLHNIIFLQIIQHKHPKVVSPDASHNTISVQQKHHKLSPQMSHTK